MLLAKVGVLATRRPGIVSTARRRFGFWVGYNTVESVLLSFVSRVSMSKLLMQENKVTGRFGSVIPTSSSSAYSHYTFTRVLSRKFLSARFGTTLFRTPG